MSHGPEQSGSGQRGACKKCGLYPSPEGHDGCLGELPGPIMNACCGHGSEKMSYIQYWGWPRISGAEAIEEQHRLIADRKQAECGDR